MEPSFAGYVVTVDYGRYISHYAHCSGSPVLSGKRVYQGDIVAYSGNTGSATTGPHLHWEVMPDGWDFNNGTYGRINPRSITGSGIAAAGVTTQATPAPAPQEDELSAAAEAQIARVLQILEAQEGDNIRQRIVAIDDRTAVSAEKYLKGDNDASLYEFEGGKLRGISFMEWQATGQGYRTLPQSIIDALPKA
ncbi:MAG: M23 family metallopeptidase [Dietzia sp.]|nr:M23 family metallopeptidase [Dietzia sp.]